MNLEEGEKITNDSLRFFQEMQSIILLKYKELLDFMVEFHKQKMVWKHLLPYHINVIDELHINECGHSRILYQLLCFINEKDKYEILESLVEYIQRICLSIDFSKIAVVSPIITQEEARIDLWIRDEKYAVIFENKIYNAADQDAQLSRYIDKTKALGYALENIYVIYLSQLEQEPNEQSWGKYKDLFVSRYINLSFRNHILPWLKNEILPNIKQKDCFLQSAIVQYIDYLEGLFSMRTNETMIYMKLNKMIGDYFELEKCKDDKERIRLLSDKIEDMKELVSQMESVLDVYCDNIYDSWKADVKRRFPFLKTGYSQDHVSVSVPIGGKDVIIRINEDRNGMYCQVEYSSSLPEPKRRIANSFIMSLLDILPKSDANCVWQYYDINDFDGVYSCFLEVVDRCIKVVN